MNHNKTILYIEDDSDTRKIYEDFFKRRIKVVITAKNGKDGLEKYVKYKPDLIITDIKMPDMNGPEFITAIRNIDSSTPILVFSAYASEPFLLDSIKTSINGSITKPADYQELSSLLDIFLVSKELEKTQMKESTKEKIVLNKEEYTEELMVVGLGASAGGLEALSSLVAGLPKNNNTAYVLAQHLSPTHKTMLVDLLSRETTLLVKNAEHNEVLESDIIYITPPNNNIEINEKNQIILSAPEKHSFLPKPSVNQLFISIAQHKKDRAVGIILSGTGSDGAQGMRAINAEGGITIVQEPSSAKYDGMPMASINGCNIDMVIEVGLIGQELVALANFPRQTVLKKHQITQPNNDITAIFNLLHQHKKVDFSVYKKTTIGRRIERRMVALKITELNEYVKILESDLKEVDSLYNDILIGVTSFFRDKEAFEALEILLDKYLDDNPEINLLRIWMPGSSTGEEAYSIAITIHELLEKKERKLVKFLIFATDIDENALKVARKGVYCESSMNELDEHIIKKYFTIQDNQFEIKKSLRENIVFSYHNLLADPPFKELDLIVCRNLLIYFNLDAQKYIMPAFHYALNTSGLMFLGKSENATNFEHFFVPVNKNYKIFKAIPASHKEYNSIAIKAPVYNKVNLEKESKDDFKIPLHDTIVLEASKLLLPNVIVTNEQLEVVYKKGNLDYIKIPEGYVNYNLYRLVDARLSIDLRNLVNSTKTDEVAVSSNYIPLPTSESKIRLIKIHLVPIISKRSKMYIFYFQEITQEDLPLLNLNLDLKDTSSDKLLEIELHRTKEHMQTLIEELETSNEELQSTNEELQSSNEELQSTNEEMETSNEELQSTNEELQTAYAELKQMYQTNTDIKNDLIALTHLYESVLENINDAVAVSNENGILIRTNKAMQRHVDLPKESLLSKNWSDFFLNKALYQERSLELTRNQKYGPYVLEIPRDNNNSTFLNVQDYVSKDDKGNIQIWSFASDISKEKEILAQLALSEQKYKAIFDKANVGMAQVDSKGRFQKVNQTLCDILGYENEEFNSITINSFEENNSNKKSINIQNMLINSLEDNYKVEKQYTKKDGTIIWVMLSVSLVKNESLEVEYFIYVVEDIDLQKKAELENLEAKVVFNSTQEAIIVTDGNRDILNVNPAFETMTGYEKEEALGKNISFFKSDMHNQEFYEEIKISLKRTGLWSGETINRTKSGEMYTAYLNINSVLNDKNETTKLIWVISDISLLKKSQDKISFLATHDNLTGLPNRVLLADRISHAISQAKRSKKLIAIFFIDLDRFKVVNDGLGHRVGDRVLIEVSNIFKDILRSQDTIARIGGDEFVIVVEDLDSPLNASKIAKNIIKSISKEIQIEEHSINIGASIGISIYPNDGINGEELIGQADIAMYKAKEDGRNTYKFTSRSIATDALEKATMEHSIKDAISNNEFEVYYQPIVDINSIKINYFEALIRWNNPQLGFILPDKFIPLAEESELIVEITKYVLFDVLKTLHDLKKSSDCDYKIAINFSLKDIKSDELFHYFKKYLRHFKLDGESITIELTERKLIAGDLNNQKYLERYKNLNVSFSMDDFGTGYSNLAFLIDKPFDTLKIDQSFVSQIGIQTKAEEVIKATIQIAKALNLKSVAEGIEREEQLEFLQKNGCDYAQGFYINVPRPIEEFVEILKRNKALTLKKH